MSVALIFQLFSHNPVIMDKTNKLTDKLRFLAKFLTKFQALDENKPQIKWITLILGRVAPCDFPQQTTSDLGTTSGGLLQKNTRSNPSQNSENPLPTSVLG